MYLYHASALALAGEIRRPLQQLITSQAAVSLPVIGGVSNAEVKGFDLKGIVSFRRAYAEASGSFDTRRKSHDSSVRVVVEELNVFDVVTVDRVVARLSGQFFDGESEPRIVPTGTYFENFRISGQPVDIKLSKFFEEHNTFAEFEKAYPKLDSDLFRKRPHRQPGSGGVYRVSLVEDLNPPAARSLTSNGSALQIPDFGRIHIAEFFVERSRRRLNMLRLELGSPVGATLLIASSELGGDPGTDDD
jgi:hypothetical protein